MKRLLLFIFISTLLSQQAVIENVLVTQRTDGSKLVDITYDLSPDVLFIEFNITVEVSLDGGFWNQIFYLQGDVFAGQTAGEGKAIVWDMGQEYPNTFNENVQVRVIAESSINIGQSPFEMVTVPAGEYTFGQNDEIRNIDYDFEISKYEITNAQYAAYLIDALEDGSIYLNGDVYGFYHGDEIYGPGNQKLYSLGDSNSNFGRINWNGTTFTVTDGYGNHPVVYVTWFGAQAFAEHYSMRLPDEYEWEKAARANLGYDYPFGNIINETNANYNNNENGTTPVGYYNGEDENTVDAQSQYGAYDMAGNVWEWTKSWWSEGSSKYILRGGSWNYDNGSCKSWFRYVGPFTGYFPGSFGLPDTYNSYIGFRVCRTQ